MTALSEAHRNAAPSKKPAVTTSHAGSPPSASACRMAGCKRDQKLAAIITPAAKPRAAFMPSAVGDRKNATVPAPSAVTSQVPSVANSAIRT